MFKSKTGLYVYISIIVLLVVSLILIMVYTLTSIKIHLSYENEKTDISVFTSIGDYTEKYTLLNEVSNEYMVAHPDVSVKFSALSDEDFNIRLQTDFASGYQPDIIITYPTRTMMALFKKGLIADLTLEFENDRQWYDLFDKSALQRCSSDGRIFAAPTEMEYIVLYANKKILESNNLAVPTNYNDLKNCISVLRSNGITPFAFGLKDENLFLYQAIAASCGGSAEIEHALSEQRFTSTYRTALNTLNELYDIGAFPSDLSTMNRREAQGLFIDSKTAFIVESSSFAGDIENSIKTSEASDTFTVLAFPSPCSYYSSHTSDRNFYPIICGVGNMTVFISSEAYTFKHDAVMGYVKYLTSPKVNLKFVSRAKYLSALKDNGMVPKKGPIITQCNVLVLNTAEFTSIPSNVIDRFIWGHTIARRMYNMLSGSLSAEDIISEAERLSALCAKKG